MRKARSGMAQAVLAGLLLLGLQMFAPGAIQVCVQASSDSSGDAQLRDRVASVLKKPEFKKVTVSVNGGVVELQGTVRDFIVKRDAGKRAQRVSGVEAVHNMLEVEGAGTISDAQLQQKIANELQYDRVFYGNAFNAITVQVQNGVAIMGGDALGPVAKSSALALASNTRGVQNVVDRIRVDPLSPMDNEIRARTYQAIYGYPTLNIYAMNPAKPIRIVVINGNVTLAGVVDSQADKDMAGMRASTVPGVFKVTNDLAVANQNNE